MARPQCDIAQAGSAAEAALNSLAASSYQKECKSAIPFSNSTCAFALQEVAKATRPMSPGAPASWWWEWSTCARAYWVGNANRTAVASAKVRVDMLSSDGLRQQLHPGRSKSSDGWSGRRSNRGLSEVWSGMFLRVNQDHSSARGQYTFAVSR